MEKCVLIEASQLSSTCVNLCCVPKKVMWHTAQLAEAVNRYAPDYGFSLTVNTFNWKKLIASRTAYIQRIHLPMKTDCIKTGLI